MESWRGVFCGLLRGGGLKGREGGKVIDFFNKRFLWFATGQGIDDSHGIQ